MFKFIPSFQSFFIANQTQATASPSFARINNKGEESGRAKRIIEDTPKTAHKK